MSTFILVVILDAYAGATIAFQEFSSLARCNYTKELIYSEGARKKIDIEAAFCVEK